MSRGLVVRLATAFVLCASAGTLGGCAYDYLQHTDRVGYSAGNAVKANIATQTTDPATSTSTKGLGKDGIVIPDLVATPVQ